MNVWILSRPASFSPFLIVSGKNAMNPGVGTSPYFSILFLDVLATRKQTTTTTSTLALGRWGALCHCLLRLPQGGEAWWVEPEKGHKVLGVATESLTWWLWGSLDRFSIWKTQAVRKVCRYKKEIIILRADSFWLGFYFKKVNKQHAKANHQKSNT